MYYKFLFYAIVLSNLQMNNLSNDTLSTIKQFVNDMLFFSLLTMQKLKLLN